MLETYFEEIMKLSKEQFKNWKKMLQLQGFLNELKPQNNEEKKFRTDFKAMLVKSGDTLLTGPRGKPVAELVDDRKGSTDFDKDAFKKDHPNLWEKYQTPASRLKFTIL